jgi:putative restriction endonuclease
MRRSSSQPNSQGPFRADQLRSGDPYELSHGHPIQCFPTGGRGSQAASAGAGVLSSDPAVQGVGIDTGFSPAPDTLRAPDLSVGEIPNQPGWVQGVPPLAVEYADTGQDEGELAAKIQELLAAGTRFIWVVRLTGPRRVEVHQPGKAMTISNPGDDLLAPGILANPVRVEALYDRDVALEATLRNLLQRQGYDSLEAVQAEGEARGRLAELQTAILEILAGRGIGVDDAFRTALAAEGDLEVLRSLLRRAATAASAAEVLPAPPR